MWHLSSDKCVTVLNRPETAPTPPPNTMIKIHLKPLALLAIPLAFSALNAQTTTEPVGVVKIRIEAAVAADQPTYSYLSTSMSAEIAYQGTVSAGGTGTITIGNDDWTADQFATDPHYVIIASGAREGEILDISSNTVNTLTLTVAEDQSDLVGESIRIHKHNTLASIFGADPAAGTVQKGNADTADHVLLYIPGNGYETYYYNNEANPLPVGAPFYQGWVNSSDRTTNASKTPIYPDDGFAYRRASTTPFTISVNGTVLSNQIKVPITQGYNLVTVPYPVDKSITLDTSNLRPTGTDIFDINIHLVSGNAETADQLLIYGPSGFETYYFNDEPNPLPVGAPFHQGWVNSSDRTTDAKDILIPSGSGIFILRKTGRPAFSWIFSNISN